MRGRSHFRGRRRLSARSLVLSALVCLAIQPSASAVGDHWTLLDIAPANADAIFALRDGATLRRTPVGAFVASLAANLLNESDLGAAWARLAERLGLSPAEAFDAILGEEAMFTLRLSHERVGDMDWAFVSVVRAATSDRLELALRSAPRDIIDGHVVLSIEQGRYWLVRTPRNDVVRLVLAPARKSALLRSVLAGEDARGPGRAAVERFTDSEAWRLLRARGGDGQALAFAPLGDAAWFGMVARWLGGSLLVRTLSHSSAAKPAPRLNCDSLSGLADAALLLGVECVAPDEAPQRSAMSPPIETIIVDNLLRDDPAARGLLNGARALWISADDAGAPLLAVALGVKNLAKSAIAGDAVMAHVAARRSAPATQSVDPMQLDFGGLFPASIRTVPIRTPAVLGAPPMDAALAWGYVPAEARSRPMRRVDNNGQGEAQSPGGWWVIGIGEESVRRLADRLASADEPEPAPTERSPARLAWGVAKPEALMRLGRMASKEPGPLTALAPFAEIHRVAWRSLRISPTDTLLTIEARFAPERDRGKPRR